jgi:hypothetical protein
MTLKSNKTCNIGPNCVGPVTLGEVSNQFKVHIKMTVANVYVA